MSEKITVELDETTLAALGRRAAARGRSVGDEICDIIRTDLASSFDREAFLERARELVRADTAAPLDRETFLRRARELAMKSRNGASRRTPTESRRGAR